MPLPNLNKTYVTSEGDMLERICYVHYGRWSLDVLKPLWEANPWVLSHHLILPAGRILFLPAAPVLPNAPRTVEMWKDAEPSATAKKTSLITNTPASEYNGMTLLEYLAYWRARNGLVDEGRRVSLEQASQPLNGTLLNVNSEVYRYSPQSGFVGIDRFSLRATDGENVDEDVIEIVVNAAGAVNRFELFDATKLNQPLTQLLFCAVKRTRVDALQVFISRAEQEIVQSHQILGGVNYAYADITILKRLTSGGVVAFGDTKRLYNTKRTDAIAPVGGVELNPGECLIAQIKTVKGNVWGMWVDAYTTLSE